jgi:hypothetical protein
MDFHKEIRNSFLGGFTILIVESIIWFLAALLGDLISFKIGILIIIFGGMFFYPLGLLMQTILKRPKVKKENKINGLFTQIGLMIPLSFPLIFMLTKENVNLFFPALTIIIGIHYLPFVYAYKMNSYWALAALLVIGGSYFGFLLPENFEFCAYYTSAVLFIFSIINLFIVKNEIKRQYI